jgi:ribosome-binding factor A
VRPTRKKRIDDLVREILGEILLTRASDPRLGLVTVTRVEISPELDVAKVFVSVLGEAARRDEALDALRRAGPFLRTELAKEVRLRRTPELRFQMDESIERGFHMDSVLRDLAEERAKRAPAGDTHEAPADTENVDEE